MFRRSVRSVRSVRLNSTLPPCLKTLFENPPQTDSQVKVNGWIKSVRAQKKVAFLDISDGTTHSPLLCVIDPEIAANLKTGQSVQVDGAWSKSRGNQDFELKVSKENRVSVVGSVSESYALQKKFHSLQFLRTLSALRWRTNTLSSILRLRSQVEMLLNSFFTQQSFTKTSPPLITSSDCEGAGELFRVESGSMLGTKDKFFGKDAFLTVSTQLHLEVLCMALSRVWTLSPTFRAESSDTNRHLAEFWMLEAEVAFVSSVHHLTKLCEDMIKSVVSGLLESPAGMDTVLARRDKDEQEKIVQRWKGLMILQWHSITYTEAVDVLKQAVLDQKVEFKYDAKWGDSLQSEHEKWLAGEYFRGPVFITDYPAVLKPFYMLANDDGKTVACFDLLLPEIGELIGGSLREHDMVKLKKVMADRNMKTDDMEWYLSLRENGTVPHGGFGMGYERLLCYLGCMDNIRDVIAFPRSAGSCVC